MTFLVNPVSWRTNCILYWNMVSATSKFNYYYVNLLHIQLNLFIGFFFTRLNWATLLKRKQKKTIKKKYKKNLRMLIPSQEYYRTKFFIKSDVLFIVIYFFRKRRLKKRRRQELGSGSWRIKKRYVNLRSNKVPYNISTSFKSKLYKKKKPKFKPNIRKKLYRNRFRLLNFIKKESKFNRRKWKENWKHLKEVFIGAINRTEMSHPYPRLFYRRVFLRQKRKARLDDFFNSLMLKFHFLVRFAYKLNRFVILIYIKKILYFFFKKYFIVDAVLIFFFYKKKLQPVRPQYILEYIKYRLEQKKENIPKILNKLRARISIFWKRLFFGLKIVFSGRNRRRNRAIYICKQYGVLPLSSKYASVDYSTGSIINHYGTLTIKIWLYKANV